MKTQLHRLLVAVPAVILLAVAHTVTAKNPLSNLRLITSVPEDDYSPTLTHDGARVVLVCERTGDKQLFSAALLPRGAVAAPQMLAPNPGDDHSPEISPDSKWLAWVSTREDAFGDVWVMGYPDHSPIQVSRRGQRDSNPRWRQDGSRWLLVYDALEPDGTRTVMAAKVGDWKPYEYGVTNAVPDPSPPFNAHIVSQPTSPGQPWVLAADDTDGDGRFDERDKRTAWTVSEDGRTWRQITPPLAGLNSPRLAG